MSWPPVKLQEIVSILSGFAFQADLFNDEGNGLPIIRIRDVVRGQTETFYSGLFDKKYIIRDNDFLIGMDGEFNIAAWKGGEALLNQRVCKIDQVNESLVDQKYLAYFLSQELKKIEDLTPYVTVKHLSVKTLNAIEIPLPPLEEQKRIAAILDTADALRAKRRAALAKLDTLLQATFLHLFGDPITNPMGWPVTKLQNLCSTIIDCPHSTPIYAETETLFACVRSSDIQNGYFDWSATKYVEFTEYENRVSREIPTVGDIVYCREGARFGNAARILGDKQVCLGQRMMLFRPKSYIATSEFIWQFLESSGARQQAEKLVGGSASPHINIRDIKNFEIPMPPIEQQQKFSGIVSKIDGQRILQKAGLETLDNLFYALQGRAFRGDL